jgi:MFS transporter, DHA1 family, inner membrane transport protein
MTITTTAASPRSLPSSPQRTASRTATPAQLRALGLLSFYDRFAGVPVLVALSTTLHMSFARATLTVTAYSLLYAVGQPMWGIASDRFGRLRIIRVALLGAVVASIAASASTAFVPLVTARAAGGLFVGAIFPNVLALIGDQFEGADRGREVASSQTFTALGTTTATLSAGALAQWISWRVPFLLTALMGVALLVTLRHAHSPSSSRVVRGRVEEVAGRGASTRRGAMAPWALALYALGVGEGAILLGVLTYLTPALERDGVSPTAAGGLAATYGAGVLVGSRLVRLLASRHSRTRLIGAGGMVLVITLIIAAAGADDVAALTTAAALFGIANSLLHGSLQTWATFIAPSARATSISLFVASVFLGSSLATAVAGPFTTDGFRGVFAVAAIASVGLTILAPLLHRRWAGSGQ